MRWVVPDSGTAHLARAADPALGRAAGRSGSLRLNPQAAGPTIEPWNGAPKMEIVSEAKCFGGRQRIVRHSSEATGTGMQVSIYLPPAAEAGRVPVLYFLSGLTCTEQNFTAKAGAQRYAAEHGLALVAPDTSPRGLDLPGEHDDWDFGSGAGFYLDATQTPWKSHYRMFEYVTDELPRCIAASQPIDVERASITGHSMGGHGALVIGLRQADRYASISAFAPIVSPTRCPWGRRAFSAYLGPDPGPDPGPGPDPASWSAWDACLLLTANHRHPRTILVDQGTADGFLDEQLKPALLEEACVASGQPLTLRRQPGYDHSYFFIASFMGDHVAHAAAALG